MNDRAEPLTSYRELEVWKRAVDLVEAVYELSRTLPDEEKFGLVSQVRRAAVSVPSNIAEGYGRQHRGDYIRHLSIANGSLKELETQLLITGRLGFITRDQARPVWELTQEVGRMLQALIASLR